MSLISVTNVFAMQGDEQEQGGQERVLGLASACWQGKAVMVLMCSPPGGG